MVLALVYVMPSINSGQPGWWADIGIFPTEKIRLGLDLQGGMHLVLEVQTKKAVENRIERTVEELRVALKKARVRYAGLGRVKDTQISIRILDAKSIEPFDNMLDKDFQVLRLVSRTQDADGLLVNLDLPDSEVKYIEEMATKQAR